MTTFLWCLVTGLICYGVGLRVAARYYRKAAEQVSEQFAAHVAQLDAAITAATEATS